MKDSCRRILYCVCVCVCVCVYIYMWKVAVVASSDPLIMHFPGGSDANYE